MDNNLVIAPGTANATGFVELARSQQGKLFRKQILPMNGSFTHPTAAGKEIYIDEAFAKSLKKNFTDKVCDIVQVPLVNDKNIHVEDPLRNVGEVIDVEYDSKGVYAIIDARKHEDDFGKVLLGASAMMHLDYEDTKSGKRRGPTLLHVAVTNRPYVTDLDTFVALSAGGSGSPADTSGETPVVLIPADQLEEPMDLNQMLQALKDDHGIDVADLQAKAAGSEGELLTALSNVIAPDKGETLSLSDVADAVIEMHENTVSLSARVDELTTANDALLLSAAEAEIDGYISEGRILPKQRDAMIELSRTQRETFETLLPENPIVSLSADGVDTHDAPDAGDKYKSNVERLAALANDN